MRKKKKMWVFGLGMAAECVAHTVGLENVVGFCADKQFVDRKELLGLPVVSYEEVCAGPLDNVDFFVATGYSDLNRNRAKILDKLLRDGRNVTSVISRDVRGSLEKSGLNCFLMTGCNIHPFVKIKNNVFIWSGATICHHCEVGNNVWVTAGATVAGKTVIGDNVFIGVNAAIVSGIRIGSNAFIGAGAIVVKDVPDRGIVLAKPDNLVIGKSEMFIKFLERNGCY